MMHVQANIR